MNQCFAWSGQSTGVSASAHSFQRNPRVGLLQNGLVGSPCSPRDSQKSFLTPQFKHINSSVLSLLHSPTLTSIHDTGKTIASTRRTLVGKVMSLLLNILSRLVINFLPRSKRHFNFMAVVTICSDFGAPQNKVWQFPLFPHQLLYKVVNKILRSPIASTKFSTQEKDLRKW